MTLKIYYRDGTMKEFKNLMNLLKARRVYDEEELVFIRFGNDENAHEEISLIARMEIAV